jgi:hypothetical protein
MRNSLSIIVAALVATNVCASTTDAPHYLSGDSWTYQHTIEKGSNGWVQTKFDLAIVRSTDTAIYYTAKPSGSNESPKEIVSGPDWSRIRSIDGKETIVNKPLEFPLSVGQTWTIKYTEPHPNRLVKSEQWMTKYTVTGNESIEVPAGKFSAIKIEAEGTWTADLEPKTSVVQGTQLSSAGTTMISQVQKPTNVTESGRTYKAIWYVPTVKRWVKTVEEYYSPNGERTERYTDELVSDNVH